MHNRFMALYGNLYIVLLSAANLSKLGGYSSFGSWDLVKLTHHFLP